MTIASARLLSLGSEKPRLVPEEIKPGRQVQRRPYGRFCQVIRVAEDGSKVLVKDGSSSVWVKMGTLVEKWA